jgi:hypothetical protein
MPGPLTPERATHFLTHAGHPRSRVEVLEACVHERVLVPHVARRIETALLKGMDAQGHWKEPVD